MSRNNTPSPSPSPRSTASSRSNIAPHTLLNDHCIRRIAIDPSVVLGSFYDATAESIVGRLSLSSKIITKTSQSKEVQCVVKRADMFDRDDVFRMIGIHEEPWLNSILNIVPSQGVTDLVKYAFSKGSNIRYLYYYCSSEEQSISQVKNTVIDTIPKALPTIVATHVVSMIKLGVQAFIVLLLPSDGDGSLDCFLDTIAEKLLKNKFLISANDKSLFNRIIVTKVFSNIPTLNTSLALVDICQKLMDIRPHTYRHCPLDFQLRTIKWFYPSYPTSKARYIPLQSETVRIIRQYLQSFSSQIEELKTLLDSEDKQTLEKHLNDQYNVLQQQINDAEQTYLHELGRIRDLVKKIRDDTIQQESIIERLSGAFNESLQKNMNPIREDIQSLQKKTKLIKKLDHRKINYVNIQQYLICKNDDLNTILRKVWRESETRYIFCSTDKIRDQDFFAWNKQCEKWMEKRETNHSLAFVYADFTYTSSHLSEVKILEMKPTDNNDKQVESSNSTASLTSETVDISREQPLSSPAQTDAISAENTSSQGKLSTNPDEKLKSPQPLIQPKSEVSNIPDVQFKETEKTTPSVSLLAQSTTKTITPEKEEDDDAEKKINTSPSSPIPSVQKDEQTARSESAYQPPPSHSIVSSNESTSHGQEQCNTPQPSMVPYPSITPRGRHRKGVIQESNTSIGMEESLSTGRQASSEQTHRSDVHDPVSGFPPPAAVDADGLRKTQPKERKQQSASSSVATSVTLKPKQASKEQFTNIIEPSRPSSSPSSLGTNGRRPLENHSVKVDRQPERSNSSARSVSDIPIVLNEQNEDARELFNLSNSTRHFDSNKISLPLNRSVSLYDPTDQTRSPTLSASQNSARQRRRSTKVEKESNTSQSSNASVTENTALSKHQTNTPGIPIITSPRATLLRKKESTCTDQSQETLSAKQSSPTEKQSVNTDTQSDQLESQESFYTDGSSLFERERDDSKTQTDSQTSSTEESVRRERRRSNSLSRPSSPPQPPSASVNYTNILLLGESGVGKSTFINALINYQAFQTFEQARSSKPLAAMPVSFLITVGHYFEEKIVRFGGVDLNEDHDHPGQSVTQHCRSYILKIDAQTTLRIIDTPGVGDTRGIDQDDQNMQHILSFISNLSHLNAICILLKPNESRLNVLLRTYFTRLLNFLGENACHNIVFCFTNTRSTFFAPGNTGPLLKKMISSLPIKDVPFQKRNTFCFDSESFRYLVALRNGIKFDSYQEEEYQRSWTASSTTSTRLIQYICEELKPYPQSKWQSIEHVHFQINQLIRPVLETTRNILRNITLLKQTSSTLIIKLRPVALSQPSLLCYAYPRTPRRFLDFWILPDQLHSSSDKCDTQDAHRKKHLDISYKLKYELIEYLGEHFFQEMRSNLIELRAMIADFGEFYGYVVDTLKQSDHMLSALEQIIAEEDQICSEKGTKCLNSTLRDIFTALREDYKERRARSMSIHLPVDLPNVYERIKTIRKIDEIKEQMQVIKETRKKYMKQHEKQVSHVCEQN